jgi:NADH-quinone oxidoreductase subunit K
MSLSSLLLLSGSLFCVGIYGLLARRQMIAVLLSIELMANAANVAFVSFSHYRGGTTGLVFAVFSLALTVAEVVVGLALVLLLYRRHGDAQVGLANEMKG